MYGGAQLVTVTGSREGKIAQTEVATLVNEFLAKSSRCLAATQTSCAI